jgi:hypothetical protein
MLWIHKTQIKTTECCKFWNDRIIEAIFKINRGYLIILGLYALEEEREREREKSRHILSININTKG